MKRRNFILGSLSGMAAASVASTPLLSSCCSVRKNKKPDTPLNICLQEGVCLGNTLEEKLDFMEAHGVNGLEVGGGNLKEIGRASCRERV